MEDKAARAVEDPLPLPLPPLPRRMLPLPLLRPTPPLEDMRAVAAPLPWWLLWPCALPPPTSPLPTALCCDATDPVCDTVERLRPSGGKEVMADQRGAVCDELAPL